MFLTIKALFYKGLKQLTPKPEQVLQLANLYVEALQASVFGYNFTWGGTLFAPGWYVSPIQGVFAQYYEIEHGVVTIRSLLIR